jgi:hypothetical protein
MIMNQGFGSIWTYAVMNYFESTIPTFSCVNLQNVSIKTVGLLTGLRAATLLKAKEEFKQRTYS